MLGRVLAEGVHVLYSEDPHTHDFGASVFVIYFFAIYLVLDLLLRPLTLPLSPPVNFNRR